MIRPIAFLVGYEILSIPKEDAARFVNLCSSAGITYAALGFEDEYMRVRVRPLSAVRLRLLCEKYGIGVSVQLRRGIPFLIGRFLSRPGLALGAVLCAIMIVCSGRIIWDVRVVGNGTVDAQYVIDTLEQCGFGVGTSTEDLELDLIENHFLILSDKISWISVNITGTVAEVEVRENLGDKDTSDCVSSNLIATRNGVVVSFEEVKGNISVDIGEAVSEGQLLVGGVYGSDTQALRFVRSSGRVFALCERDYCISVPLEFEKKTYTGEQKIKKSLIFFEKEVKFFGNYRNLYASCDTIDTVEYFNFFGLGNIPIGIRTVKYVEYVTETATRTEEQAEEQAVYELWQIFYGEAPDASLVGKTLEGKLENGAYVLYATVESVENIAKEVEIEIDIMSYGGKNGEIHEDG